MAVATGGISSLLCSAAGAATCHITNQQRVKFLLYTLLLEKVAVNDEDCQSAPIGNLDITVVAVEGNEGWSSQNVKKSPHLAKSLCLIKPELVQQGPSGVCLRPPSLNSVCRQSVA